MKKKLQVTNYKLWKSIPSGQVKKIVIFFAFCFSPSSFCFSQPQIYWNEWINFSQTYYKIPIAKNGIYRLDFQTLSNAGINPLTKDSRNFQIFFRGQEQYIYVEDKNGNDTLDTNDYIEFYGQKNDGSLDSVLYKGDLYDKPVRQPNPYYSLFNDTSAYFLTWNNLTANNRIVPDTDTAYSSIPQTNYFMKEIIIENHTNYYAGKFTAQNINFPEYHEAEGWSGVDFDEYVPTNKFTVTFNTSNTCSVCPQQTEIKLALMGESNDYATTYNHKFNLKYKDVLGNYISFDTDSFNGYSLFDSAYYLPSATFGASTELVVTALSVAPATASRNTVPYAVMKFPHNMNLENKTYYEMFVPDNSSQQSKSNFSFTNFNDSSSSAYLYDFTNHLKIQMTNSGGAYKALVPNAFNASEKFCVVKSENHFLSVPSIKPVRGTGFFTDYSAMAADSAYIIITHNSLMSGALAYQNYRADPSTSGGGGHNVIVADIDELYDQFAYGIPKHPFAIRHFADYCTDVFPSLPQDLFLIGKSIQTDLIRNNYSDPSGINYANCLVPSIGFPTSDNMLVAVLNGNLMKPAIPLGRLAAKNNPDITNYLDKVRKYEHPLPNPDEWMKHIIHLRGGDTPSLQGEITTYLLGYETTLEDTSFGGYVHTFKKNSSLPTQTAPTDSIRGLINNGVSLITFFGHSSASIFDYNLLPPEQYNNNSNGKYPFFSAYGCSAGDIHKPIQDGESSSEIYVLTDKGMIGFLASSGPGTPPDMDKFASNLYKNIGKDLYGQSIGKCIQSAIDTIEGNGTAMYINATCLEMTLHGDPAIVIHASKLPDYAVNNSLNNSSVYFTPAYVSTDLDSFDMNVIVTNIGKATNDSVKVDIKRVFVDGTSVSYSDTLPYLYYKDTVIFTLPVDPIHGPGLNKFEVHVDPLNSVDELDNFINNNIIPPNEIPLLIYSGDIIPVYPYKYAIVPNDTIILKAYTANPFALSAQYIFEVDTTDLFNSFQKKTQYATQMGAVIKTPLPVILSSLPDSTVYFWRVRRDDLDTLTYRWRESSFQYIPNKRGWGQSHFFQFLKGDKFSYIDTNRVNRSFDLDFQTHAIEVGTCNSTQATGSVYFNMDGQVISFNSSVSAFIPHVLVSVINPITGVVWSNINGNDYGSFPINPCNRFEFLTSTPSQQETLRTFLQDSIPCGSKVILYTSGNHNLGDILGGNPLTTNPGLVQAFMSIGGTQFSAIQNNYPYILIGRKCGTAVEELGANSNTVSFLSDTLMIKRESGYIFSETVGPASKWESMHWKYRLPSPGSQDSIKITVIGIKNNGDTATLIKNISKDYLGFDIYNLDNTISADTYPYLKLTAWVKDSIKHMPAQLTYWRVYYDGVPEASLNPFKNYTFYNPSIQQGDSIKMSVAIENIGDYDMDSLWVDFWVYDSNRSKVPLPSVKLAPLLVDSFLIANTKFPTVNLNGINIPGGLNSLWVEANPFNAQHQLEQYHFNNIGTIPFNVNTDKINPLMDVTFDGVHIMNGDLVSAKPNILIKLKDENTFLALNDPSDFDVRLKRPGKTTYDTVLFGSSMTFEPAVLPSNSCKINYMPALPDGIYELKVQAKDRSGNNSGIVEYKISFEVINKPTVTSVLNYPNPFSTSTRFVFTLTGSEVPDYFKIQIITISGKMVREINKQELGWLHIGRNITEYAWDGKDEFGDQLANGLYLYRVITQLDGKSLEHRETTADPFFTQGYGKMYLIR
ncbi:MAG: hypothetical protein HY841_04315 [Bacteroidetes bacterium]|nr:hypothetical protein [Bacteroidota bacterium]